MRCAALTLFEAFCDKGNEAPLTLRVSGAGAAPEMESERLRAAGSMSGMVDWLGSQRDAPECFHGRRRPIRWSELLWTRLVGSCHFHLSATDDLTLIGNCRLGSPRAHWAMGVRSSPAESAKR